MIKGQASLVHVRKKKREREGGNLTMNDRSITERNHIFSKLLLTDSIIEPKSCFLKRLDANFYNQICVTFKWTQNE